ncbi:surface-adhesin E family protein [Sphingomonas sp. Sphisp140]|uniref:surface-adhesin E family protein n=1 Tax=unclassified Sphingomonas TaxID=196159 RepID=UPI0039AF0ED2
MRLTLLALAALVVPHTASAQNWRLAAYSNQAPQMAYFVDVDSVRRNGNVVTFKQQTIYETTSPTRDFDRSMLTRQADCAAMTSFMRDSSFYVRGTYLDTEAGPSDPTLAKPGTVLLTMLETVCGRGNYFSPVVTNPEIWVLEKFRKGF